MNCPLKVSHVIRRGDNLYQLAGYYQTTVPSILAQNPSLDPYNLQVGTGITVCTGENFAMQSGGSNHTACPDVSKHIALIKQMRVLWERHVYWTRMLIISIAERLKDENAVTARLLQNPGDLAEVYARYYSQEVAEKIAQLLTENLKIGAALITALRDGKTAEADRLDRQWYINADQMADAFSSINPYYNREKIRDMLYDHLQVTTQETAARLAAKYQEDIDAFDRAEQEILMMADYFSAGIMRQFPQEFI